MNEFSSRKLFDSFQKISNKLKNTCPCSFTFYFDEKIVGSKLFFAIVYNFCTEQHFTEFSKLNLIMMSFGLEPILPKLPQKITLCSKLVKTDLKIIFLPCKSLNPRHTAKVKEPSLRA